MRSDMRDVLDAPLIDLDPDHPDPAFQSRMLPTRRTAGAEGAAQKHPRRPEQYRLGALPTLIEFDENVDTEYAHEHMSTTQGLSSSVLDEQAARAGVARDEHSSEVPGSTETHSQAGGPAETSNVSSRESLSEVRQAEALLNGDDPETTLPESEHASNAGQHLPPPTVESRLLQDDGRYRPIINLLRVPAEVTIQSLLSTIRVPHGRILLADFDDRRQLARIVFAEISAHNTLLEMAFQGCFPLPWSTSACLEVNGTEVMETAPAERVPSVTRILQIHGLHIEHRSLDVALRHLCTASGDWLYSIEKVLLMCAGEGDSARRNPFVQINFASVRDALHAKRALQGAKDANLVAVYRTARFAFGHDDCSTTGAPLAVKAILDMRGGAHAGPREDIAARGYVLLPPHLSVAARWQEVKARVIMNRITTMPTSTVTIFRPQTSASSTDGPSSSQAPTAAPLVKQHAPMPVPPFDTVKHGIFVAQIPASATEADVLGAISGGRVRRIYIFRPGRNVPGTSSHAAVFFTAKDVADRVLQHIAAQGGLRLALTGRRYRTLPYIPPAGCKARPENLPQLATRIVSITVEDLKENKTITADSIKKAIHEHVKIALPIVKVTSHQQTASSEKSKSTTALQSFGVELTSIHAARMSMTALKQMQVAGATHLVKYEPDPCEGPLDKMK